MLPVVESTIAKYCDYFHVESTIDYFVSFLLIVLGFKTQGIPWVTLINHM